MARLGAKREMIAWGFIALFALALLTTVLTLHSRSIARRSSSVVQPKPELGSVVFQKKGCANCHGSAALGTSIAPALRGSESLSSVSRLVSAMWNHAPLMWDAMDRQRQTYPELSYEQMGQLVSFLYFSRFADDDGDPTRGAEILKEKHCTECHAINGEGAKRALDLASMRPPNAPIEWTQILWNHASKMQAQMREMNLDWPNFAPKEMADLFAYVRRSNGHDGAFSLQNSNPERGWEVFQRDACINCHSVTTRGSGTGPTLGQPGLPTSYSEFGALMLNHFPKMQELMTKRGGSVPVFSGSEMLDLAGFVYSLQFVEPSGSALVGASVFSWRGCAACHGVSAEGMRVGPPLRGVGQTYTANRLATDLWRHGARMHRANSRMDHQWPTLQESDIGNLLSFLNSPPESR